MKLRINQKELEVLPGDIITHFTYDGNVYILSTGDKRILYSSKFPILHFGIQHYELIALTNRAVRNLKLKEIPKDQWEIVDHGKGSIQSSKFIITEEWLKSIENEA